MNWQLILQQLANLTTAYNNLITQARKIWELPWQNILNPASKIHVSNPENESEFITIQQILDAALSYRQNQLIEATISVDGNDVTVDAGAKWVINNVNHELESDYLVNIPYAATGYTRNDILYADEFNQIHIQTGPETEGVSPTPNTPLNTVLVTIINVTDSTIGYVPPVIGGDYESKSNKQNDLTPDGTGNKYPTVDAVNNALSGLVISDATTTSKGIVKLSGDLSGTADAPTVPRLDYLEGKINHYPSSKFKNTNINPFGVIITGSGSQGSTVGLGMDVVFDAKRDLYVMLYASWNGTGINQLTGGQDIWAATSKDLKTWTKISDTTPVIPRGASGSYDFAGGTFPQLYYEESTALWHMYYIAFDTTGFEKGVSKIAHATCADLLGTWTKTGIVFQSPSGWLSSGDQVYRPCVVKKEDIYYMFFNGGVYGNERFGYATSTTLSGTFVAPASPIIPAGTKAAPWCFNDFFSDPQVFFEDGKWYCAFWSIDNSSVEKIGMMWTTPEDFPLNWRAYDNPLNLGAGAQQRPLFLKKDGDTYLIYNTGTLGALFMNMATSNVSSDVLFPQITITTAVSITTATNDSSGNSQKGRNVAIANGASAINLTVNTVDGFCASYVKHGSATISFVQGSGRTLVQVDGTLLLNGAVGSTASISSVGTTDYLRISNA